MRKRIIIYLLLFFAVSGLQAQETPLKIKYAAWDIHALRNYPFTRSADTIVAKMISTPLPPPAEQLYEAISTDVMIDHRFLTQASPESASMNDLLYRYGLKFFGSWLSYATLPDPVYLDLNVGLFSSFSEGKRVRERSAKTLFDFVGRENLHYILDEMTRPVDLRRKESRVLLGSVLSPLHPDGLDKYHFFLSSRQEVDSVPCYEVVFFSKRPEEKALEGYLYISEGDYRLMKSVFTLNYTQDKKKVQELIFLQTPQKNDVRLFWGDDIRGSLVVSRSGLTASPGDSLLPLPLTPAQKNLDSLLIRAEDTRAYRILGHAGSLALTGHLNGSYFRFGPLLQTVNYNKTEGLRLRLGGQTTERLSPHWELGGYAAYGFRDENWKYRGDLTYIPRHTDRITLTYIDDLNRPGYDLQTSRRDHLFYIFRHSGAEDLSHQKLARISYEKQFPGYFSFRIGGHHLSDTPIGKLHYSRISAGIPETISRIETSELNLSLRFAPGERYIRVGGRKFNFSRAPFILELNHRSGLKGLMGSDYAYQITDFSAFRKTELPGKRGSFTLRLSGGKSWSRVPFPLLFIPAGNQSYLFEKENYNLMKYHEFVTDRYLSAHLNGELNWSPVRLFYAPSKAKTTLGFRTLYGPLSRDNNPEFHPDLFLFNNGIEPLGNTAYTEVNIGLSNILRFFRVDYVYRLNYGRRGALFFSTSLLL